MGYDLHLVRTADWLEAESDPIAREDVDRLIAADSTLSWSTTNFVSMEDETGEVGRFFMIDWNGVSTFWWYRSEVTCKDPTKAQILKLLEMARSLRARVVGDDGERYELRQIDGQPQVVRIEETSGGEGGTVRLRR